VTADSHQLLLLSLDNTTGAARGTLTYPKMNRKLYPSRYFRDRKLDTAHFSLRQAVFLFGMPEIHVLLSMVVGNR
jgi:hypothetical protein